MMEQSLQRRHMTRRIKDLLESSDRIKGLKICLYFYNINRDIWQAIRLD